MPIPGDGISCQDESPDGTVVLIAADKFESELPVMIFNRVVFFGTDIVTEDFCDAMLLAGCDEAVQHSKFHVAFDDPAAHQPEIHMKRLSLAAANDRRERQSLHADLLL